MGFDQEPWNFLDWMYLFLFPLAQLICLTGVMFFLGRPIYRMSYRKAIAWPKNILAIGIMTSLILVVTVWFATPDKTPQEIEKRLAYKKHLSEGDNFLSKGSLGSAQVSFEHASALMPSLWSPYFKQGIVFGAQNKFEKAEKQYRLALDIYPDHPSILANYGATLAVLGKTDKAEIFLRNAIRQRPNNSNAYNSLAQIYLTQNKLGKAKDMLLLAVSVNPNFGIGYANLAMLYAMINQSDQAKAYLKIARELGVKNSTVDNLQKILQNSIPTP